MPRIEQKDVDELVPMHVDGYSEEWAESLRWQLAMSRMNQRRLVVENARLRDQEELAKALHEVVWAPGASFDRASEASHEYMQRCARLVLLRMLGETERGSADPVRCPKCGGPDPFHDPACVVHPDLTQDHNEQEQR